MRMLYDCVLLRELKEKSAVIRPEKTKIYPDQAEVMSVGPGDAYGYPATFNTTVKKGDKVYFIRDRAMKVELKTGKFYIVKERDILGIMEKGEV
jgi:co-chaperonin GroES (HSP10)